MGTIERVSVREVIRDAIIERIVSGEYMPGCRLVELRLAEEFGTSQGPVREAFRELEAQRLVESEPHRGTRVRAVRPGELVEIYHVRGAIERLACEILQASGTAPVPELRTLAQDARAAGEANDIERFVALDYGFHDVLTNAAGNTVLRQTWESLLTRTRVKVLASIAPKVLELSGSLVEFADEHLEIVHAFETGGDAGIAMKRHLDKGAEHVREAITAIESQSAACAEASARQST